MDPSPSGQGGSPRPSRIPSLSPALLVGAGLLFFLLVTGIEFQHASDRSGSDLVARVIVVLLFNIDVVLAVLLLYVLLRSVVKIYWNRTASGFGSGFQARLIGSFLLMVMIPSFLLFVVASGFLNTSVQRWFTFPVSASLRASSSVSRAYDREVRLDVLRTARSLAMGAGGWPSGRGGALAAFLSDTRRRLALSGLELYRVRGEKGGIPVRLARSLDINVRLLDPPGPALFSGLPPGGTVAVQKSGVGTLVRALVPVTLARRGSPEPAVLVVDHLVPERFSRTLAGLSRAYTDYRELRQFRNPIRQSYLLVFFMITIMIIFGAVWFGLYLARRITRPLLALEKATEEVARGNLSVRVPLTGEEEFGVLVESFNQMTSDLALSTETLQQTNLELSHRREYMEKVLEHIGTGVFSLNREKIVTTFNRSAEEILAIPRSFVLGRPLGEVLHPAFHAFDHWIDRVVPSGELHVEEEVTVDAGGSLQTYRMRYNRFEDPGAGAVVVFDDVTTLQNAQKALAWREVAQRIAHEIKNPLTPIQLAAERLRRKFSDRAPDLPQVFEESIRTIVSEVAGIKHLVDEFSTYARLPESRPVRASLEPVLLESVVLYRSAHREVVFEVEIEPGLPDLLIDPKAIRRVFSNLFENAIEAMGGRGRIGIRVFADRARSHLRVEVADDGPGVPPEMADRIFLPYFSTREKGSGLGLAIVSRIVSEHRGGVFYSPGEHGGSVFTLDLPIPPPERGAPGPPEGGSL